MDNRQRLSVKGVVREFEGGPRVLNGVDLEIGAGETVAIVGPSGSGKSTLLNIVGTLDKPTAGKVAVDGVEVTALEGNEAAAYRAGKVGFVFQDHHLLPQLTGVENVILPTLAGGMNGTDVKQRALDLLESVGVGSRGAAFPGQMSGGERQRVAVARALVNSPGLLLCDEPTGNLDHENGIRVVELFVRLAKERGVTVIMVTHNLELAGMFSRCYRLTAGKLEEVQRGALR
jgi:lipoprotein-releasing system ATP-binding protein